jgi:uncharacterized low-complexity protein|tara:strand:+ start:1049 stop:1456 length:408 start_codon:yes stop_codon:yes gene_type:complete
MFYLNNIKENNMSLIKQTSIALLSSVLALSVFIAAPAKANTNPFASQELMTIVTPDGHGAHKCGEGKAKGAHKCGEGKAKTAAKCGEGKTKGAHKCGEGKAKIAAKCGQGKCGEGKAKGAHKCGEGKAKDKKCGG